MGIFKETLNLYMFVCFDFGFLNNIPTWTLFQIYWGAPQNSYHTKCTIGEMKVLISFFFKLVGVVGIHECLWRFLAAPLKIWLFNYFMIEEGHWYCIINLQKYDRNHNFLYGWLLTRLEFQLRPAKQSHIMV